MIRSYHIITFGCQMNVNDSERIAGVLEKLKLNRSGEKYSADLIVINTCAVRKMAEDRVYGAAHLIKKKSPVSTIILTGCMAHRKDVQRKMASKVDYFVKITELPLFLKKLIASQKEKAIKSKISTKSNDFFKLPPLLSSPFSASVPIMTGCNNFCSYCVVPYARGREVSRDPDEIIWEITNLIKKSGIKEIILLGQNVNSYKPSNKKHREQDRQGRSQKPINGFPALLEKVAQMPGEFWIRFITSHPKDMSDKLIKVIAQNPKITKCIHLPFQAGSNRILKLMNRGYTIEKYLKLFAKIKKEIPRVALTTDIIVGFPGETEGDFQKTASVMRKVKFDMAYISEYSPRPETAALKLKDDVPLKEKKRRKKILSDILSETALENNRQYLGRRIKILLEKRRGVYYLGKTETYKNVKINSKRKLTIGEFYEVKITKARDFGLESCLK